MLEHIKLPRDQSAYKNGSTRSEAEDSNLIAMPVPGVGPIPCTISLSKLALLRVPIVFPVHILKNFSPTGVFSGLLARSSLPITLESAIVYAGRYLHAISAAGAIPKTLIDDWENILRWEVGTYWLIDPARNVIDTVHQSTGDFSQEHAHRSGEFLAYGISLAVADAAGINPSHAMFETGIGARPDFALPLFTLTGKKVGLEARCRSYQCSPSTRDMKATAAKKGPTTGFGTVLCVYLNYGPPLKKRSGVTKSRAQTRILLVDPEAGGDTVPRHKRLETIVRNYLEITRRIGLPLYFDRISVAHELLRQSRIPRTEPDFDVPPADRPSLHHPQRLIYGGQLYVGRRFSSLLSLLPENRDRVERLIAARDFGSYSFRGLNYNVLRMLATYDWNRLERYRDPVACFDGSLLVGGATVTGDGYIEDTLVPTDPNSQQAREIIASLNILPEDES